MRRFFLVGGLTIISLVSTASATDLFSVTATSNGQTAYKGSTTLNNLINSIGTTSTIQSYLPSYTDTSAANMTANLRGVPVYFTYTTNSTTLNMSVPSINLNQSFTGATRQDSQTMLSNWFKNAGTGAVESLMKQLAAVSPVDPIAGNPNSIMSQNVANTFSSGFTDVFNNMQSYAQATPISQNAQVTRANAIELGAQYISTTQGGLNTKRYALPLAYSFVSSENPVKRINLMAPIGLSDTQGAKGVDFGLGASVNYPILDNWIITPSLMYGAAASIDMGSMGQVGTASATSALRFDVPGGYLGVGNMVGYTQTMKIYSGQYAYDPGIRNTVFKNGLIYGLDTSSILANTSLEFFGANTTFTGTKLYLNSYNEFGFSYGFAKTYDSVVEGDSSLQEKGMKKIRQTLTQLRIGATYLAGGGKSNGFQINFGYSF